MISVEQVHCFKRNNLFRILIMNFMDAHDFDVRAVKKSCVHIVSDKMKIIPFETIKPNKPTKNITTRIKPINSKPSIFVNLF